MATRTSPVRARAAPLVPSAPFEEHASVPAALTALARRTFEGGASSILFLPQKGVAFDAYAFAYRTGLPKQMNITRRPRGPLRGTLIINASGHATGGVVDRMLAYAHEELVRVREPLPTNAEELLALRNACDAVHRAFQSDPQRTRNTLAIEAPARPPLPLTRARYDELVQVRVGSEDYWKGNAMLRATFAATNSYIVRARLPDGSVLERRGVPRNDPHALEVATRIPIELPDVDGTVTLQAWPMGSAEVGGYREAREYAIHLGSARFDVERANEVAAQYAALHDEVRWDTEHEADDLVRHGVAPAPFPYLDF